MCYGIVFSGTVAIWNLMTESRLLKRQKDDDGKTFCKEQF